MKKGFKRVWALLMAFLTVFTGLQLPARASSGTDISVIQGKTAYTLVTAAFTKPADFDKARVTAVVLKDDTQVTDGTVTVSVMNESSAPADLSEDDQTALNNIFQPTISGSNIQVPVKVTATATATVGAYSIKVYYDGAEIDQNVTVTKGALPSVAVDTVSGTCYSRSDVQDYIYDGSQIYEIDYDNLSGSSGTLTLQSNGKWLDTSNRDVTSAISLLSCAQIAGDQITYEIESNGTYTHTESIPSNSQLNIGTLSEEDMDTAFYDYSQYVVNGSVKLEIGQDSAGYYWRISYDDGNSGWYYRPEDSAVNAFLGALGTSLGRDHISSYDKGATITITQTKAPVTESSASYIVKDTPSFTATYSGGAWVTTTTGFVRNGAATSSLYYDEANYEDDMYDLGIYYAGQTTYGYDYIPEVNGDTITYNSSTQTVTYTSANQQSNQTFVYSGSKWHLGSASGSEATLLNYGISISDSSKVVNGDTITFTKTPSVSFTGATALGLTGPSAGASHIPASGTVTYTYNGSQYKNGSNVMPDITSYGYTLTGTPRKGDQITIKAYDSGDISIASPSLTVEKPHEWTYIADGNKLMAYCSEPTCDHYGTASDLTKAVTLELNVSGKTYDGTSVTASYGEGQEKQWKKLTEISAPTISYLKLNAASEWESVSGAPTAAGDYKAVASLTANSVTYQAYKEFTISKAEITSVTFTEPSVAAAGTPAGSSDLAILSTANYTGTISWLPADTNFKYNTSYTATVTLTAKDNYVFASAVTWPDGWTKDTGSTETSLVLKKTYDATAKAKITSVTAPGVTASLTAFTTESGQLAVLPASVAVTVEDASKTSMQIDWTLKEGTTYTTASGASNTFTWQVVSTEYTDYDTNGMTLTGDVVITNPTHTHDFSYSASGNMIKAYCTKNAETSSCSYDDANPVLLTVTVSNAVCTGLPVTASYGEGESTTWTTVTGLSAPTITYYQQNAASEWESMSGTPVNVGKYKAEAVLTAGGLTYTAFQEFRITNAMITSVTFTEPSVTATGTPATDSDLSIPASAYYTGTIAWSPEDTSFGYNKVYTATLTFTAKENFAFDENVTCPDGFTVSENTGSKLVITKTYDATAKAKLLSLTKPKVTTKLTAFTTEAGQLAALPDHVAVTVEDGSRKSMAITWTLKSGTTYSTASRAVNTFVWHVTNAAIKNYDANGTAITGKVEITNPEKTESDPKEEIVTEPEPEDETITVPDEKPVTEPEEGKVTVPEEKQEENDAEGKIVDSSEKLKQAVLDEEDQKAISRGKDVNVWVEVKDQTSAVSKEDAEAVTKSIPEGYENAVYLEITLWKQVEGSEAEKITEIPNGKVKISITIPEELRKEGRTYRIMHVHDGITEILDAQVNEDYVLTFETDAFSTYSLIYADAEEETPDAKDTDLQITEEQTSDTEISESAGETTTSDAANGYAQAETSQTDGDGVDPVILGSSLGILIVLFLIFLILKKGKRNEE